MDKEDKTIIVFGDDDDRDIASEYTEESNVDDYVSEDISTSDTEGSNTDNAETSYGLNENVIDVEAEPVSDDEAGFDKLDSDSSSASNYYTSGDNSGKKAKSRSNKEPHYITRGGLIVALIITMVVSSVLGAFISSRFFGSSSSSTSASNGKNSALTLAEATDSELTIAEIVDKNADAVVEITVSAASQNMFGQTQLTEGAGSGVIMTADGYIVTNYHVIEGATSVSVTLHNGDQYDATIVGTSEENDIAVIKIEAENLTVAEIGDSSSVQVGDLAVAIGNPLGQLGGTATQGIISALDRTLTIDDRTLTLMQTDAAINPGNSGGGLFDGSGNLIGIVDAKSSGTGIEGLAFAIPINSVIDVIDDIIENGGSVESSDSSTPVVGVVIQDVSEDNAQYYNLGEAGVYIAQVTGSNAQKAGFQSGDRIVSIDGEEITDTNDFVSKVRSHKVGDTVSIIVERQGQQIEIKTVLEASSQE